jgi:hypothetical protein
MPCHEDMWGDPRIYFHALLISVLSGDGFPASHCGRFFPVERIPDTGKYTELRINLGRNIRIPAGNIM